MDNLAEYNSGSYTWAVTAVDKNGGVSISNPRTFTYNGNGT